MIDVDKIVALHRSLTSLWHIEFKLTQKESPWIQIEQNNMWNFKLWHEEDIARITDIEPERIVIAKRNIDFYNQERNNAMERIDEWVLEILRPLIDKNIELHSETPGMMIDRLSIMNLKLFHMQEEAIRVDADDSHKIKCLHKVGILLEQINDLKGCLDKIFQKLSDGQIKFKVYRQLKMYNDPTLNPELYKRLK